MPKTKEQKLADLCQEIYRDHARLFKPFYPWILIRVLPKEQEVGSILLLESQRRFAYEGIVLSSWEDPKHGVSEVEVGDRILFPHFEGLPLPDLDEKYYRIVRERVNQKDYPNCGIFGKLSYDGDAELRQRVKELFKDTRMITYQHLVSDGKS